MDPFLVDLRDLHDEVSRPNCSQPPFLFSICGDCSREAVNFFRKTTVAILAMMGKNNTLIANFCQEVPGKTYNNLREGFSALLYDQLNLEHASALRNIHYCVREVETLRRFSEGILPCSFKAADFSRRLRATSNLGSREEVLQAIEELRSSPFLTESKIPKLREKLNVLLSRDELCLIQDRNRLVNILRNLLDPLEENASRKRAIINHDFLVLELQECKYNEIHFINAEKVHSPNANTGICLEKLQKEVFENYRDISKAILFSINCGPDKHFTIKALEDILLDGFDPNYRLADACCWDYAVGASKKLIRQCAKVPGTSDEEKKRLEEEALGVGAKCSFMSFMLPRVTTS